MNNGTILNNTYQIIKSIGSGGVGIIYLGYHLNLQKHVVIKKVKDHSSGLMNNRIEVDILKSLHHTYHPQVYDFLEIDDGIFTVMDYISGHDLMYYLESGYQFPEEQIVLWMKQLCEVLAYLHSRKPPIIHCDIKPGNIMITDEGNICLIDFNISLDGENNKDLVGLSGLYASPEQVKKAEYKMRYGSGDKVKMDQRTDIFSLGAVFYYIMTGIKPNVREQEVISLRYMDHLYNDELANIVDKAMETDPAKRFKSAEKMLDALEHMEKWNTECIRRMRRGAIVGGVTGCLALVLLCAGILGYREKKKEDFFEQYELQMEMAESWKESQEEEQADQMIRSGIRLLNRKEYQKQFKKYTREKANVLFGIGEAYLSLENYSEAETFLRESLQENDDNPEGYRDLAIAQICLNKMGQAESSMNLAVEKGLPKEDASMIQAELAMQEQRYEEAWQYGMEAAKSSDTQMVLRAAGILLDVEEKLGNTRECIDFLQHMAEQSRDLWKVIWLRKEGELCVRYSEENSGKNQEEMFQQAMQRYEIICETAYAELLDWYNLASVYDSCQMFSKEKEILLDMKQKYPDEYEVCLRLSNVCYRVESNTSVKIRDYGQAWKYYQEACKICENQGISPDSDVNMLQMKKVLEQLETKPDGQELEDE